MRNQAFWRFARRLLAHRGLLAGAILATTPVATLMFRFNNPDALLVLLLVVAMAVFIAYLSMRALALYNTLRAAYPYEIIPYRQIWAAYIAA